MSDPPQTRPGLSADDLKKLASMMEGRGASVNIQDPRVSQVQTWLVGIVGIAAIGAMGWMANSIDTLSHTMVRSLTQQEYQSQAITANTAAIKDHERRITIVEAKR